MTNTWHPETICDIRILSYFQINWVDPVILPLWCVKGNVDDVLPKSRFFLRQLYTIFDPEAEYNGAESGRGEIVILSLLSGETVRRCGRNKEWTGLQPLCRGKEKHSTIKTLTARNILGILTCSALQSNTSWLQWELFAIFFWNNLESFWTILFLYFYKLSRTMLRNYNHETGTCL